MLSRLREGEVVAGRYRVVTLMDVGGMGEVYEVLDEETHRSRVLKLLAGVDRADAKTLESFRTEARVGARIHSEHVVEVTDAGVESGCPWLVMEKLDGQDLHKLIEQRGAFTPAQASQILAQLCHGLGAAHDVGVVHRDLKPANIFVARAKRVDVSFTVKILDFGIARVLGTGCCVARPVAPGVAG